MLLALAVGVHSLCFATDSLRREQKGKLFDGGVVSRKNLQSGLSAGERFLTPPPPPPPPLSRNNKQTTRAGETCDDEARCLLFACWSMAQGDRVTIALHDGTAGGNCLSLEDDEYLGMWQQYLPGAGRPLATSTLMTCALGGVALVGPPRSCPAPSAAGRRGGCRLWVSCSRPERPGC